MITRDRSLSGRETKLERWRRRWYLVPIGLIALAMMFAGYGDRSERTVVELGSANQITIINSAGPVRVHAGESNVMTHSDSWLWTRPVLEVENVGGETIIRVVCDGRGPCRSAIDVELAGAAQLVVIAKDMVEVDRFDGALTAMSSEGQVVLGPIGGSARVLANQGVNGYGLVTEEIDVATVDGQIDLAFVTAPRLLAVDAEKDINLVVPGLTYNLEANVAGDQTINARLSDSSSRIVVARTSSNFSLTVPDDAEDETS